MARRCARCGRRASIGAFCERCYPIQVKVPEKVVLLRCPECGRVKVRGEWKKHGEPGEEVIRYVKGDFARWLYDGRLHLFFEREGQILERVYEVKLEYRSHLCPFCEGKRSKRWTAKVQLRGEGAPETAKKLLKEIQRRTYGWMETTKHGPDVYAGSTEETIRALAKLKLGYRMSKTLMGVKEGKRVYRTTFSVRLGSREERGKSMGSSLTTSVKKGRNTER